MDASRWYRMSVSEQILNIGGELQRAADWKEKGDRQKEQEYLDKALEWFDLSKMDPKNQFRTEELNDAMEETLDYFGSNRRNLDRKQALSYWDSYLSAIY